MRRNSVRTTRLPVFVLTVTLTAVSTHALAALDPKNLVPCAAYFHAHSQTSAAQTIPGYSEVLRQNAATAEYAALRMGVVDERGLKQAVVTALPEYRRQLAKDELDYKMRTTAHCASTLSKYATQQDYDRADLAVLGAAEFERRRAERRTRVATGSVDTRPPCDLERIALVSGYLERSAALARAVGAASEARDFADTSTRLREFADAGGLDGRALEAVVRRGEEEAGVDARRDRVAANVKASSLVFEGTAISMRCRRP